MNITIIGSGNVGTVLSRKLKMASHNITLVPGRSDLLALPDTDDLYLIAIKDDELYRLKDRLQVHPQLVVHTAGSVSMDVLQPLSANIGVLYPLQGLRKEVISDSPIPFLVDGNSEKNIEILQGLASGISGDVRRADDATRRKYHLAAVITNNFINHLLQRSQEYCQQENIDFGLLMPLLTETINRLHSMPAAALQTGPATRGDEYTLEKQREMLQQHPPLLKIYNLFSDSISAIRSS